MSILVNKHTRHPGEGRGPEWLARCLVSLDSGLRRNDVCDLRRHGD